MTRGGGPGNGIIIERAVKLVLFVQRRGKLGVTVRQIADELDVSLRQAQRYIHALEASGFPLMPDRDIPDRGCRGGPAVAWRPA